LEIMAGYFPEKGQKTYGAGGLELVERVRHDV